MTDSFRKLMQGAAPETPDSSEFRRLHGAVMQSRTREAGRRRRRRIRRTEVVVAVLAFLALFTGKVSQLGSDDFEFETSPLDIGAGRTVPMITSEVRGKIGTAAPGMTRDDIVELQQQILLDEGESPELTGYAFDGGIPDWTVSRHLTVNGQAIVRGNHPSELSVPTRPAGREVIPFLAHHFDDFLALIDAGQVDSQPYGLVTADGVTYQVRQYSKEYPEWGVFTYYRGVPVSR